MKKYYLAAMLLWILIGFGYAVPTGEQDQAIRQYRMGTILVKSTAGAVVSVRQQEHEFWFGTAVSSKPFDGRIKRADCEKYLQVLKENFNAAVHENALKWQYIEKNPGVYSYETADKIVQWCRDNGLRLRGHCVFWSQDKYVQGWVKSLDNAALKEHIDKRINDLLTRYKGQITEYDVNNEMVHNAFYKSRLGPDIRAEMFRLCHRTDPNTILYVNDYHILSGKDLEAYIQQIESLLATGAPVGGIGLQGHFGEESVDAEKVKRVLDRLAVFGLPIKITEFDINTQNEKAKAAGLVDLYTTCFAHPAVEGILMWGFWEKCHWRPHAALWKKDWTPTPAARAYRRLVFEKWWTVWDGHADERGECRIPAFFGRHRVVVNGENYTVYLHKQDGRVTIDCTNTQ